MISEYWFTDWEGHPIHATFRLEQREQADHVLLYAFATEGLLLTKHKRRGLELPGGKRELGESEEEAVAREAWEETGVQITTPIWLGQYTVYGAEPFTKSIWYAWIEKWHAVPLGYETVGGYVVPLWPDPLHDERFSTILRDPLFYLVQARLCAGDFFQP